MSDTEEIIKYNEAYEDAIFGLMFHGYQSLTVNDARDILTAIKDGKIPLVELTGLLK